jgi:hypothetical protein
MTESKFSKAMNCTRTWNGALSYNSPDPSGNINGRVSLFTKGVRGLNIPMLYKYLSECALESLVDTFVMSFRLRDPRGGSGERTLGRQSIIWLFLNYPKQFRCVMNLIPEYGRWDDLLEFFPKVLDLTDIEKLRANYSLLNLTEDYLFNLQALQQEIVLLFAQQLKNDLKNMNDGKPVTLCAKWSPTEGDSMDVKFGIFKTLASAMKISPRNLRKVYNTPLREYLRVVETYMCTGRWAKIDYNKVPSSTMKRLKQTFEKHDPKRFNEWKTALALGDPKIAKVNAKTLHPHELITQIRVKNASDEVIEAQWNVIVEETRKLGTLKDCIVVADTSSSMYSPNHLPIDVSVTMALLVSQLVEGDFHGHVLTFNTVPAFQVITDGNLHERFQQVFNMEWGGSTDLEATFKLILNRGIECKLTNEDMPKRLFIVSDMQFNQISNNSYITNMENINKMYLTYGYTRPQIVFWNVNGSSTDFPTTTDENNTVMISGFSPSILKAVLNGSDFSTEAILRRALDDTRYNPIRKALFTVLEDEFELVSELEFKLE